MNADDLQSHGIPWPDPVEGEPLVRCTAFSKPGTSGQPIYGIKGPKPQRTYLDEEYDDYGNTLSSEVITRTDEELAAALASWERIGDDGFLGFARGAPQPVDATFETANGITAVMMFYDRWIVCSLTVR